MKEISNRQLIKKYNIDIGIFYIYKNFVIAEIKEGITTNFEISKKMFRIGNIHYGNTTPFVYISNRVNSYSIIPTEYFKSIKVFPNLKGFAVVTYNPVGNKVAQLEKLFIKKPTAVFQNFDDAIDWAESLIVMD